VSAGNTPTIDNACRALQRVAREHGLEEVEICVTPDGRVAISLWARGGIRRLDADVRGDGAHLPSVALAAWEASR